MATSVQRSRQLSVPADQAWAALAAFADISAWAPNADHSCSLGDLDRGPGAARRVQVGRITLVETVVDWEPPHRLAYRIEGLPTRLGTVVNEWRLQPEAGGTRATISTTVDTGARPPQRLIERLVARRLASASDQMLAGLSAHLTNAGATP